MKMHNPPHPGEVLRELCLKPLGLTVTKAAGALGVSRKTLSSILNGHQGISPEMAVRLSLAFNTTAESWMNQQVQHDLWHAERNRRKLRVKRLSAAGLEFLGSSRAYEKAMALKGKIKLDIDLEESRGRRRH